MKITVGFSTTNNWWSRTIRWFTEAQVSHTYIKIYDEFLQVPLILHADLPGVVLEHADIFNQNNIIVEEFVIDDDRLNNSIKDNLKHLRKKYNWRNVFHWALVLKFKRWFKIKVKKPTEDPKKLICVDLVIRILNDSNITHLPLGELHPKSLREWFHQNYEYFNWRKEKL